MNVYTDEEIKQVQLKLDKARELQTRVEKAAKPTLDWTCVHNLRTGTKRYQRIKTDRFGTKRPVLLKYKVNGKYYVTTTEIIQEYGLSNRGTVLRRLNSIGPKWVDWILL